MKILFLIMVLFSINQSYSQIPQLISYQGVLTDNSGNLVSDGSYNLTFNLYTVSVGGSSIWTEIQSVTTTQGVFNVNLGAVTPFTIGFSSQYYLGVTIGGVEMSPRTQLTSAAYAMNGVPPGTILNYGGTSVPAGYLICDGSAVSRTTYASLFASIGTAFGIGNGTTTFNLPDLRGRFVRGVDASANLDPDKATRTAVNGGNSGNNVGSVQTDAFQGHWHNFIYMAANITPGVSGINQVSTPPEPTKVTITQTVQDPVTDGINGTPRTSSETRPSNIYLYYIIKF